MTLQQLVENRFGVSYQVDKAAANPTLENLLQRRSCRRYTDRQVPGILLDTLFCAAFSAPSKSDLQQACVIHVSDGKEKKRLASASQSVNWIADAPVLLVWCGDSRRIRRLAEYHGEIFANDHLDAFMNAAVDAGIAMQTFIVAAESVGLGCCPVSQLRDDIDLLSTTLGLPEHVFPVAGLCVGWPAEPGVLSQRLPLRITVHENVYDDAEMINEVRRYDRRRCDHEHKTMAGEQSLPWSRKRTRQYSVAARQDFGAYIRRQKFDLS